MPSRSRVVLEELAPWYLARLLAMFREIGAEYELLSDGTYRQSAVISAWRSRAHQRYLYDLYRAGRGNLAAWPGTSNHEGKPPDGKGEAVDLVWWAIGAARVVARKYGFHFPIPTEAWHLESLPQLRGSYMGYSLEGSPPETRKEIDMAVLELGLIQPGKAVRKRIYLGRVKDPYTAKEIDVRGALDLWAAGVEKANARVIFHAGDNATVIRPDLVIEVGPNTKLPDAIPLWTMVGSKNKTMLLEVRNEGDGVIDGTISLTLTPA